MAKINSKKGEISTLILTIVFALSIIIIADSIDSFKITNSRLIKTIGKAYELEENPSETDIPPEMLLEEYPEDFEEEYEIKESTDIQTSSIPQTIPAKPVGYIIEFKEDPIVVKENKLKI